MTRTSPLVDFSIYDPAIKQDSTPLCTDIQSFSKVADLEIPSDVQVYGSYEPDFWLLDGHYKLMPTVTTNVHVGWTSLSMSDAAGAFASPPTLTITFTTNQTVTGLTLKFSQYTGDWCDDLDVAYYNSSDVLIQTNNHTPTSHEIYTATACAAFRKIIITFNSTNKPYRYLRLLSIDYGKVIHFTSADIKSCVVTEEINMLSTTLPINTLDLVVYSASFSILDTTGDYFSLQEKQPLDVYELVGNSEIYIGRFYLDDWDTISDVLMNFKANDAIALLDGFYNTAPRWLQYGGTKTVSSLVSEMFADIDIPYNLDASLASLILSGTIPICTYRDLLQQIAFSINAYVTCSRSSYINIIPNELVSEVLSFDYSVSTAEKGIDQLLVLEPYITGVEVLEHKDVEVGLDFAGSAIYSSFLTAGSHVLKLSVNERPVDDLDFSGTAGASLTLGSMETFSYTINVPSNGTVIITHLIYFTPITVLHGVYNPALDYKKINKILIDNSIFANVDNSPALAQRIYDYYQQRYYQKVKLYNPEMKIGDSVSIEVSPTKQLHGIVEKMTTNLSGGFTSKVEIRGIVV